MKNKIGQNSAVENVEALFLVFQESDTDRLEFVNAFRTNEDAIAFIDANALKVANLDV